MFAKRLFDAETRLKQSLQDSNQVHERAREELRSSVQAWTMERITEELEKLRKDIDNLVRTTSNESRRLASEGLEQEKMSRELKELRVQQDFAQV